MPKQSLIEKVLARLDDKIARLQAVKQELLDEQKWVKPRTKPRPVKVEDRNA